MEGIDIMNQNDSRIKIMRDEPIPKALLKLGIPTNKTIKVFQTSTAVKPAQEVL